MTDILEAAHAIRAYLPDLLGAEAETCDRALADLLARATAGEAVETQILELLAVQEPTREWTAQYLADKTSRTVTKSYRPISINPSLIPANVLVCPVEKCTVTQPQPKIGIELLCEEHRVPLVLDPLKSTGFP